ncbi:VOC family protein [Oceanithermus sp.]
MQIGYVVFYTPNIAAMKSFYLVLGLEVRADYGMWVEFETGSTALALHEAPEDEATENAGVFFEVEDVGALHARLREKGLAVSEPKDQDFGFRTFTLRDPQGNRIEFGQPLQP